MSVEHCRLVPLQQITEPRGNIGVVECGKHIPFPIKRVYYLYDVPGGADRGGHAHKELQQLVIPLSGSFDITLEDGFACQRYQLNRATHGLYIAPGVWRTLNNFSSGSVCVVLASEVYDEADYYRDYDQFYDAMHQQHAMRVQATLKASQKEKEAA